MRSEVNFKNKLHILVTALCVLLCLCSLIPHLATGSTESVKYPLEHDVRYYNAYVQQFDAFMKGQLYLDIEVSEELLSLDNPYDWQERKANEIGYYPWDRALYDGHYYSYFGIAPILTVFFPSYFLTGSLPAPAVTCAVLAVLGMVSLAFLLINLLKYFNIKPPLYLFLLSLFTVELGSLLPMLMSSADMYYIACTSAVSYFALFLALFFGGINCKKIRLKNTLFTLCAVSFALVIMSRPNMALLGIIIIPALVRYFFGKENSVRQKAVSFFCFAVPLTLGAAVVFAYNYLRFGSPFEFGAKYQLTVYDVSKYTCSASLIFPAVYHYFLQFPRLKAQFPFIDLQFLNLHMHTTEYLYNTSTIGAMPFLSNFGAFAVVGIFAKDKKYREQKTTYALAFAGAFLLAFFNICMGGVNIRYFADIALVMIMFSSLILLEAPVFFKENKKYLQIIVQVIISFLFIASAVLGFLMIFENERNYILNSIG